VGCGRIARRYRHTASASTGRRRGEDHLQAASSIPSQRSPAVILSNREITSLDTYAAQSNRRKCIIFNEHRRLRAARLHPLLTKLHRQRIELNRIAKHSTVVPWMIAATESCDIRE